MTTFRDIHHPNILLLMNKTLHFNWIRFVQGVQKLVLSSTVIPIVVDSSQGFCHLPQRVLSGTFPFILLFWWSRAYYALWWQRLHTGWGSLRWRVRVHSLSSADNWEKPRNAREDDRACCIHSHLHMPRVASFQRRSHGRPCHISLQGPLSLIQSTEILGKAYSHVSDYIMLSE